MNKYKVYINAKKEAIVKVYAENEVSFTRFFSSRKKLEAFEAELKSRGFVYAV